MGRLVDADSMAAPGGVWGHLWTPPTLSHTVQKVMEVLTVFCLGLVDSTVDFPRVGRRGGGCLAGLFALGEDLSDVGVHVVDLARHVLDLIPHRFGSFG